jgi:hypothetical protein
MSLPEIEKRYRRLDSLNQKFSWWRLGAFFAALTFAAAAFEGRIFPLSAVLAGALFVVFIFLVRRHARLVDFLEALKLRIDLQKRREALRLGDLDKLPELPPTEQWTQELSDLDILGAGGLVRRLNFCSTQKNLERLLKRFSDQNVTDEIIIERQELVEELRRMKLLRSRYLVGMQKGAQKFKGPALHSETGHLQASRLEQLLSTHLVDKKGKAFVALLGSVQLAFMLSFLLALLGYSGPWVAVLALGWIVLHGLKDRFLQTKASYDWALSVSVEMGHMRRASRVFEKFSQVRQKPRLTELLKAFAQENAASLQLRRLERVCGALAVRQNPLLYLGVHLLMPWDALWTLALEKSRLQIASRLPLWMEAFSEFEVNLSLAEFADQQKQVCRPELIAKTATSENLVFEFENLRHPLLDFKKSVPNTFSLGGAIKCVLITGSNMSGKSTFLRTIGLNALMAKAGLPAMATKFRFQNLPIYTSLRVADSIVEGLSTFYAEVQRMADILKRSSAGQERLIYLLDEIFRGTNNRERLIGSRAFLKAIVGTDSYGLVTTHDLELADLDKELGALKNCHFREDLNDGKMYFSYKIAEGPCPSTNAVEIMRQSGIPIGDT